MTVLAWDGKTLAADRRMDIGGTAFYVTKITRVRGALLGFSGTAARFGVVKDWYAKGANPETYPARPDNDESVLVEITSAGIRRFESTGYPLQIEDRLYADGAGMDIALAALHCGRTAKEAVEMAAQLVPKYVGGGVDTLQLEESA